MIDSGSNDGPPPIGHSWLWREFGLAFAEITEPEMAALEAAIQQVMAAETGTVRT